MGQRDSSVDQVSALASPGTTVQSQAPMPSWPCRHAGCQSLGVMVQPCNPSTGDAKNMRITMSLG